MPFMRTERSEASTPYQNRAVLLSNSPNEAQLRWLLRSRLISSLFVALRPQYAGGRPRVSRCWLAARQRPPLEDQPNRHQQRVIWVPCRCRPVCRRRQWSPAATTLAWQVLRLVVHPRHRIAWGQWASSACRRRCRKHPLVQYHIPVRTLAGWELSSNSFKLIIRQICDKFALIGCRLIWGADSHTRNTCTSK